MTGALIILVFTVLVGLVLWLLERRRKTEPKPDSEAVPQASPESADGECCGMHIVCEKQSLSPVSDEIEYFDDEELDAFRGREADSYTEEETDSFRDVLLTLPADEIASWARSIQLRGITLPSPVREELLMIVAEARTDAAHSE